MIQVMVRWVLIPLVAAVVAALVGGPWLGYDPLFVLGFALGACVMVLSIRPATDALIEWGLPLGTIGFALACVKQIPPWLEWVGVAALGIAVALLVTFVVTQVIAAVNWVRTRAWHY